MILFCDKDYCKFSWPEGPRVIMKSKVMTIVISARDQCKAKMARH